MAESRTSTADHFTDGAAYERLMGRWSRAVGEIFLDWLAAPPGIRWLDAGCGTGAFTELIVARCAPKNVSGIDPSAEQIAYARTKPIAAETDFRIGDAQALPFADASFDAAAMALVLSFIPDPAKAMAELRRVVAPDGFVGAYMWDFFGGGSPPHPLRDAIEATGTALPAPPGRQHSRLDDMRSLFAGAGLDAVATRTIEVEVSYANFDEYWSAQTGLANAAVQAIRKMSGAQVERLKAYLNENLPRDRSGRIAYPARANAVKGRVPR